MMNIIGGALGYNINFLTFGAGEYQVVSRISKFGYYFSSSCCYEPRDTYYIKLGAIVYNRDYR